MQAGTFSPARFIGREFLVSICWLGVIALAAFTILSWAGLTVHRTMAALQMFTPWLGLLAGVPLLVAFVLRRPALAVLSGFCVIANVVPIWGAVSSERPAHAVDALTVYVGNLRYTNPTPRLAAEQAVVSGADVVVVVELTSALVEAFRDAGADARYPFQTLAAADGPTGFGIYSSLPVTDAQLSRIGPLPVLSVQVPMGDESLRLDAIHTEAPSYRSGLATWRDELAAIDAYTRTLTQPTMLVGDFNATRWHPGFRDILDGPVFDAHEAVGKGLTSSWPSDGLLGIGGPVARLDHAIVHGAEVVDIVDFPAAGSDHLPFLVSVVPEQP